MIYVAIVMVMLALALAVILGLIWLTQKIEDCINAQ